MTRLCKWHAGEFGGMGTWQGQAEEWIGERDVARIILCPSYSLLEQIPIEGIHITENSSQRSQAQASNPVPELRSIQVSGNFASRWGHVSTLLQCMLCSQTPAALHLEHLGLQFSNSVLILMSVFFFSHLRAYGKPWMYSIRIPGWVRAPIAVATSNFRRSHKQS